MDCCHHEDEHEDHDHSHGPGWHFTPLFIISGGAIALSFLLWFAIAGNFIALTPQHWLAQFAYAVVEQMNDMWLGLIVGILSIGFLAKVPKEVIGKFLGKGGTLNGIFRAVMAGVVLDLCSHGILLVGMKLYQRGASLGQVMAFLIASPWNSLSLTLILWALIGFKWMMIFLILSLVVGLITGLVIDGFVSSGILPPNPNQLETSDTKPLKQLIGQAWPDNKLKSVGEIIVQGTKDALPIVQWLFIGVLIASVLRLVLTPDQFAQWFGASLAGLGITMFSATVIEVCSEGSVPIAADILNRAAAPGNAFAFLMAGVSTDYTEIMALKETTGRWKMALFLPLVTLPQIVLLAFILNQASQ